MEDRIVGSVTKIGVVLMEHLEVRLDLKANEQLFGPVEPAGLLKRLLEQEGIPVNSLRCVSGRSLLDVIASDGGVKCYHVVYPPAEKSNTICF